MPLYLDRTLQLCLVFCLAAAVVIRWAYWGM